MALMNLKPAPGVVWLQPEKNYTRMSPEGDTVEVDPYYHRGLRDGDLVEIVEPAKPVPVKAAPTSPTLSVVISGA